MLYDAERDLLAIAKFIVERRVMNDESGDNEGNEMARHDMNVKDMVD